MKTILALKFVGECKAPTYTTRRGVHLFCSEPTEPGATYCRDCAKRMYRPTTFYDRSQTVWSSQLRAAAEVEKILPVDEYMGEPA